jgi:hypothetical protein
VGQLRLRQLRMRSSVGHANYASLPSLRPRVVLCRIERCTRCSVLAMSCSLVVFAVLEFSVCFEKGQNEEMSEWGCGLEKTRCSLLFISLLRPHSFSKIKNPAAGIATQMNAMILRKPRRAIRLQINSISVHCCFA